MSSRDLYEAILIELHKENAPNILLEEFNYYANKAISQYINKRYNIYDINQQTTDDLRVLKSRTTLTPTKVDDYNVLTTTNNSATYEVILPSDYLHLLNCICVYKVNKTFKCYNKGTLWRFPAKRLTADLYSYVLDNYWQKPDYKRPYYYIHNVNTRTNNPTNPYNASTGAGTDVASVVVASINKYGTFGKETVGERKLLFLKYDDKKYYFVNEYTPYSDSTEIKDYLTIDDNNEIKEVSGIKLSMEKDIQILKYTPIKGILSIVPASSTKNSNSSVSSTISQSILSVDSATISNKLTVGLVSETSDKFTQVTTDSHRASELVNLANELQPADYFILLLPETTKTVSSTNLGYLFKSSDSPKVLLYTESNTDAHNNNILNVEENLPTSINIFGDNYSNVERTAGVRYGNVSLVRLEIRYGTDASVFELVNVFIDYIKSPQHIRLTQEELDYTEDYSQMLEFPDYVCQEIINELVHIIMEVTSDLRLQTHPVVTLSIANPTQQLTQ